MGMLLTPVAAVELVAEQYNEVFPASSKYGDAIVVVWELGVRCRVLIVLRYLVD